MTELSELAGRYPHQLSGGQQQRVALARALAPDPAVVLLDEPFSSLDAALRLSVRLDVTRILRQAGTTTVIVTHDQDEALSLADQVAILRDGVVAQTGRPHDVYSRPADVDLAHFVGEANLLPGTVRADRVVTAFGALELSELSPLTSKVADGTEVVALLRPEQIEMVQAGQPGAVRGVVTQRDYHGHDALVVVAVEGDPNIGPVSIRCAGFAEAFPGDAVAMVAHGPVVAWTRSEVPDAASATAFGQAV
jgi:iron(III) transport system ATP-binding protein